MTDLELGWLAGLLEGEGSFLRRRSPRISVDSSDYEVVNKLKSFSGVGTVTGPYKTFHKGKQCKDRYHWQVGGEKAVQIMHLIFKLMSPRRQFQITNALEVYKPLTKEERDNMLAKNRIKSKTPEAIAKRITNIRLAKSKQVEFSLITEQEWDTMQKENEP